MINLEDIMPTANLFLDDVEKANKKKDATNSKTKTKTTPNRPPDNLLTSKKCLEFVSEASARRELAEAKKAQKLADKERCYKLFMAQEREKLKAERKGQRTGKGKGRGKGVSNNPKL